VDLEKALWYLKRATNVFDSAAVLYDACRDREEAGWRFADVDIQVHNDRDVLHLLERHSEELCEWLRSVFEGRGTTLESIRYDGASTCAGITEAFQTLQRELPAVTWACPAAAWYLLQAIDQAISTKVPALLRQFSECDLHALNQNQRSGMSKVFPKMPSPFYPLVPEGLRLPAPGQVTRSAANCLGSLAFFDGPESRIRIISREPLWLDFRQDQVPKTAVILPVARYDSEFPLRGPGEASSAVGVFWVEARESETYRRSIVEALREADRAGTAIALLPELSGSPGVTDAIRRVASAGEFTSLRLIAAGSYHARRSRADERKDNVATVLDGQGNVLWRQGKREPFHLTLEQAEGELPTGRHREWIAVNHPQLLACTPIGGIAVMVCLDFVQPEMLGDLCALACRWFLVPACTPGLRGKFDRRLQDIGDLGGAIGAIANNPRECKSSESRFRFYRPVGDRKLAFPEGEPRGPACVVCDWRQGLDTESR